MSIKHQFRRFAGLQAAFFFAQTALSLYIIPKYYINQNSEDFTKTSLLWASLSISSLMDLGIGRYLTRQIGAHINDGAQSKITRESTEGIVTGHLYAGALTAVLMISGYILMSAGDTRTSLRHNTELLFWLAPLVFATISANITSGALEGSRNVSSSLGVRFLSSISLIVMPALAAKASGNWAFDNVVTTASIGRISAALVGIVIASNADLLRSEYIKVNWESLKSLKGGWFTASNIAGLTFAYTDRFVIAFISQPSSFAVYSLAMELISKGSSIFSILTSALFPLITRDRQSSEIAQIIDTMWKRLIVFGLFGFISAQILSHITIRLWLGAGYNQQVEAIFRILLFGWVGQGLAQFQLTRLHATGNAREPALLHLTEILIFLPALALLTYKYGVIGAAITWTARSLADLAFLTKILKSNERSLGST